MSSNDPFCFAVNAQDPGFQISFSTFEPLKANHPPPQPVFVHKPLQAPWGLSIDSVLEYIQEDLDLDFYNDLWTVRRRATSVHQTMKKRRSVQSILIPSFLQGSSSSTPTSPGSPPPNGNNPPTSPTNKRISRDRAQSSAAALGRWTVLSSNHQQPISPPVLSPTTAVSSPRDSPPPDFLLDDDPFANLSAAPCVSRGGTPHATSPPTIEEPQPAAPTPRSPLMPSVAEIPPSLTRVIPTIDNETKKSPVHRAFTSSRILPVAAHQRPAYSSRPSLPSLSTLAQMNVVLTKKPRKGRVGAGLPFEPWDNPGELPSRVLQDVSGTSTQSLPQGTQPLLPSQIIGIATGNMGMVANATEATVTTPSHSDIGPSSASGPDEISSTLDAISEPVHSSSSQSSSSNDEVWHPSLSPSSSELGHENDLLDGYLSRGSSSDLGHREEDDGARTFDEEENEDSHYSPFSVYGHQYANSTDFDTDTTNTSSSSTSCDESSLPHSSRVSSLDLLESSPTLSRSISISSSRSISSIEEEDEELTSRVQDALLLEEALSKGHRNDSGTDTTRSSLDDTDSLRSPLDSEYHFPSISFSDSHSYSPSFSKPSSSFSPLQPSSPGTSTTSSLSQTSPSASSVLGTAITASPPSYFPLFSSIYAQESTDLVTNWRDQFGEGFGPGPLLSDFDLSDPLLASSPPTAVDQRNLGEHDGAESVGRSGGGLSASSFLESDVRSHPDASSLVRSSSSTSLVDAEPGVVLLSSLTTPPPSLPTHIPSPKSSDENVDSGLGGFLLAGHTAGLGLGLGDAPEGAWPSSADTVRPLLGWRANEAGFEGAPTTMMYDPPDRNSRGSFQSGGGAVMEEGYYERKQMDGHYDYDQYPQDGNDTIATQDREHEHEHEQQLFETRHSEYDLDMMRYEPPRNSVVSGGVYSRNGNVGMGTMVDGSESPRGSRIRSHPNQEYTGSGGGGAGQHSGWGTNGGRYNGASWGRQGRSGGGGGDDEDDEEGRRRRRLHRGPESPAAVVGSSRKSSSSAAASDNSDGDSVDGDGMPIPTVLPTRYHTTKLSSSTSATTASRLPLSSTATSSSDDDDVPLAQRIPTALTAQKSIRKQVQEERQQKRLERAATTAGSSSSRPRDRHATLRPSGVAGPAAQPSLPLSSSQEAAMHSSAQQQPKATTRRRALTTTSKPAAHDPFSAEDLAMRLQNVQIAAEQQQQESLAAVPLGPVTQQHQLRGARGSFDTPERSPAGLARGRSTKDYGHDFANGSPSPLSTARAGTLRLMRSFQRDKRSVSGGDELQQQQQQHYPVLPANAEQRIAMGQHQHQLSRSQSRVRGESSPAGTMSPQARKRSLSIPRAPPSPHAHDDHFNVPPVPPMPHLPGRMSIDEGATQQHQFPWKLWKSPGSSHGVSGTVGGGIGVGRTSTDVERSGRSPAGALTALPSATPGQVVQQRVFVGDMQRFNMVEITAGTTAGDVVDMIEAQGALNGIVGSGGWMVWEVVQDFGMERPIRSFELLSDVQASWNKDKMVNLFVLKMTPLAVPLGRSAIPSSSPVHSGYIEWEAKRGKWSKRWMTLREHSLWLSKRQGKEEVLLCALSNFDAYHISRSLRAPKPFAFAVKSTDSLTFFENTADYLHNFACNEKEGNIWMEKILVARSYVLHQERQVLFNPKSTGGGGGSAPGATTLSRSGTRKSNPHQRPVQAPLISVPPPYVSQATQRDHVFEPGSLLHKHP